MYDSTMHRDYIKSELDYRRSRVQADIAGRRRRRSLGRALGRSSDSRWDGGGSIPTALR